MTTTMTSTSVDSTGARRNSALSIGSPRVIEDDRSSSLSELEDDLDNDDDDEVSVTESKESEVNEIEAEIEGDDDIEMEEVDSETETERLETTPRKADAALLVGLGAAVPSLQRSPSKLVQELEHEVVLSREVSPGARSDSSGSSSRKRKRDMSEASSLSEAEVLKPLPKRASLRSPPRLSPERAETPMSEDEPERPEEEPLDDEEDPDPEGEAEPIVVPELEEVEEDEETVVNQAPPTGSQPRRGRKPKRRGRGVSHVGEEATGSDVEPVEQDGLPDDPEEEDSGSLDEELSKKKAAIDSFAAIEKLWVKFREIQVKEQLQRVEAELELLRRDDPTHPEYLAQIACVDVRRNDKVKYETRLLGFDIQAVRVKTVAERTQHHSQYFQACRELKDAAFENCNKEYYALQNDRRRYGAIDSSNLLHFNPKRSAQIQQQSAYNMEVSLLSGIAKHVGFPSAPEIRTVAAADIDSDLRAMGIATTVPVPAPPPRFAPPVQQSYITAPKTAETETNDSHFFEQNPWANPPAQHSSQTQYHTYQNMQGQPYLVTPAPSRKLVDPNGTHGSASTIELPSNPPSSIAKQSQYIEHNTPVPNGKPTSKKAAKNQAKAQAQQNQDSTERIITTHNPSSLPTQNGGGLGLYGAPQFRSPAGHEAAANLAVLSHTAAPLTTAPVGQKV